MELPNFTAPLTAITLGAGTLWLLHRVKHRAFAKPVLTPLVVDIVTAGILLYVLCIWVIGSVSVLVHRMFIFVDGYVVMLVAGLGLLAWIVSGRLKRPTVSTKRKLMLLVATVPITLLYM